MECLESDVFVSLRCDAAWIAASSNTIGGMFFLAGSIMNFFPGYGYASSFSLGVGGLIFALGSAGMIVLWRDEQFGLAFFSALNHLKGPSRGASFSVWGAAFIMIYCLAATMS